MTTTTTNRPTRDDRILEAHGRIDSAVRSIHDSTDWEKWLQVSSKFHNYSFSNALLIMVQRPYATLIAGAGRWHTMKRWVSKGEKAIWIFAPMLVGWSAEEIAENPERIGTKKFLGFKTVPVFDVSQTEGQPLPERPVHVTLLDGEGPEDGLAMIQKMIEANGFAFRIAPLGEGANGLTDFTQKQVTITTGLSGAQAFKTGVHEIAHMLLHGPDGDRPERACRTDAEVEAESVAYIVCDHFGLQTGRYSFGYVAGWAARDSDAVLRAGQNITSTAKKILSVFDPGA